MEPDHIDRQPPRDEEEARQQDEAMRQGAASAPTDAPTQAPAEDLDEPGGS